MILVADDSSKGLEWAASNARRCVQLNCWVILDNWDNLEITLISPKWIYFGKWDNFVGG